MEDQPKSRFRRTTARIQQQSMELLRTLRATLSPMDSLEPPPPENVAEGTKAEHAKPAPTPIHGKVTCGSCGQTYQVGYVACPKCKAKLPQRAPTSGRQLKQGGTSSAASGISIGVVAICAVFTIVASYLAYREIPEVRGEKIVNDGKALAAAAAPNATAPAVPQIALPPGTTPSIVLENKLRANGVSSWVDVDQTDATFVVIRTVNCSNPHIQATLMQSTDMLRQTYSGVRCLQRFNAVGFEQRF